MMEYIRKQIKEVKDYSTNSLKSLKKTIPKEEVDALIKVRPAATVLNICHILLIYITLP